MSTPPSQRSARWQQLVAPSSFEQLLRENTTGRLRLFEVGCGAQAGLARIAGAGYLDTNRLESAPYWNKVADGALLQVLLGHGIAHDSCVILYGHNMLAAARAAHLMLYAGVSDVRLLDGAPAAWRAAGLPLLQGAPCNYPPASHFGAPFPARPDYLIGMAQAMSLLQRPDAALVSIRSRAEFCGLTSGYSYIDAKGDIPGARWGQAGFDGDVNSMSAFRNHDGMMKPAADIARFWSERDIHPGLQTAFYCGTGWRASLAFFYAWLMGWQRISVYDGGWYEWSNCQRASLERQPA
jgi:3-mercaptopyruvate sulfurtransferase SseA